ncbi:MAG: hypothetical protein L3K16_04210 [Thermoplasmata archaeon]|nr:hypothetical protein [Thermoplasmata archaeon]
MRAPPEILRRDPVPPPPTPPARFASAEERAERIRFSFPLLLLGAASLVASFVLYSEAFGGHATRVPLWVLALSVGLIASVGGTTSLLVGDYSGDEWRAEAEASEEYVVVDRAQWQAIQDALATAGAPIVVARPGEGPISAADELALPEWSEPATPVVPAGVRADPPAAPGGPPAPMAVTHGIDVLATEVERMVADLEATAAGANRPLPPEPRPAPRRPEPGPLAGSDRSGSSSAVRAAAAPVVSDSRRAPSAATPRPATKSAPSPPPVPPAPIPLRSAIPAPSFLDSDEAMAAEYRVLLGELERRAATVLGEPAAAAGSDPGTTVRCVGCDARLGRSERTESCRSCRSPMCAPCAARSASEGYRGLCALCSILEESARRDGTGSA